MKCSQEQAVYTRNNEAKTLIVGMYVDDLIFTGTSVEGVKEFNQQMMKEFEMIDLSFSHTTSVLKWIKRKITSY